MSDRNYPPGVTGREPQIAGDTAWEDVHELIDATCKAKGWTDCDAFVAWSLGTAALEAVRKLGGTLPSDTSNEPAEQRARGDDWLSRVRAELADSFTLAEGQLASEKLAGNVVKAEFWKGELAALHRVRHALNPGKEGATPC